MKPKWDVLQSGLGEEEMNSHLSHHELKPKVGIQLNKTFD